MYEGSRPVALVTGAAGGIGGAVCTALDKAGFQVVGVDHRVPTDSPTPCYLFDLARSDVPAVLLDLVELEVGLPSVLVNSAGVYRAVELEDVDADYIDEVFAVNVRAPMLLTAELVRRHRRHDTGAVIVNVASISGQIGSPDSAYAASKGGLLAFTKGAGRSLAPHGIRVVAVAPGIVDTEMARRIPAARLQHYTDNIPLGRLATSEEVAAVVAFLVSPEAAYVTGAVVDVNGGLA